MEIKGVVVKVDYSKNFDDLMKGWDWFDRSEGWSCKFDFKVRDVVEDVKFSVVAIKHVHQSHISNVVSYLEEDQLGFGHKYRLATPQELLTFAKAVQADVVTFFEGFDTTAFTVFGKTVRCFPNWEQFFNKGPYILVVHL